MNTQQNHSTLPINLSLADLTTEQLQSLLAQVPADMLKKAANDKVKSAEERQQENEKAYKQLEAEVIPEVAKRILNWTEEGRELKAWSFEKLKPLIELKLEIGQIKDEKILKRLKNQKSHRFTAAGYAISVGRRSKDSWNSTIKNGIAKIEEYINSRGMDEELSSLLVDLIEKDGVGSIKASSILALQKKKIDDPLFKEGVRIITEAWEKKMTCFFLEVGQEDNLAKMTYQPTSLSAYPLPDDFEFNYFQESTTD